MNVSEWAVVLGGEMVVGMVVLAACLGRSEA